VRGPKINAFMSIIRGCQDIIGTFIFQRRVRAPSETPLVCVEADAGWVPHFMYPHGPRVGAPPLLADGRAAHQTAEASTSASTFYATFPG